MKNTKWSAIFIIAALAICLVPSLGTLIFGPSQAVGNERPAAKPALTDAKGGFNTELLSDANDYFSSTFYLRPELITAYSYLASALDSSSSKEVVAGRDGWLFYADSMRAYAGLDLMSERELWCAARSLSLTGEYVESRGGSFLFVTAPDKNSLYGEKMPSRYGKRAEVTNAALLTDALSEAGVMTCDLFAAFALRDETLYFKTDSHWSSKGAALAADALLSSLGREAHWFAGEFYETPGACPGDIFSMLYPAASDKESDMTPVNAPEFEYVSDFRTPEDMRIETKSGGEGRLFMLRDSFGNSLYPYLAADFGEALFSRKSAFDYSLMAEGDTVVWELVERNLPRLLTSAPIFPAPERTEIEGESAGNAVSLTVTPGGITRITGSISPEGVDADSPIYIKLGGLTYEATPVGQAGGYSFTAYVPAGVSADGAALYFRSGNSWMFTENITIQ